MIENLKYPIGCKISWCGEEYDVLENYDDQIICNFYFSYQGEEATVIKTS